MTAKREYSDYLTRLARNSTKTVQEFNKENIVREVGKNYGLSEKEMDEVGNNGN
jgi:predicted Zn-dependent protease with MMP-like domain